MLDIKFLESAIPDVEKWTYGELKGVKCLSKDEVVDIIKRHASYKTRNIEEIFTMDDIFNLCVTSLYHMNNKQVIRSEDTISITKPSVKVDRRIMFNVDEINEDNNHTNDESSYERVPVKGKSHSKCGLCYYDNEPSSGECYACAKGIRDSFLPSN